jgi:hypothetical protein
MTNNDELTTDLEGSDRGAFPGMRPERRVLAEMITE